MPIRKVVLTEYREARKLEALRAAAKVGELAIERGEYTDFSDVSAMNAHLGKLADGVAARPGRK